MELVPTFAPVGLMPQMDALKRLAAAVAQAGQAAAAQGDTALARQHFDALKNCGTALDSTDSLALLRLVGNAFKKMADAETAKLAP